MGSREPTFRGFPPGGNGKGGFTFLHLPRPARNSDLFYPQVYADRDPSFAALASFPLSLRTLCDGVYSSPCRSPFAPRVRSIGKLMLFRREAGLLIPSQFRGGVRAHTPNTNTRPS